ncbi:MAG: PKD domain-containing protein [Candidatus Bathyarchaeia archaeon]
MESINRTWKNLILVFLIHSVMLLGNITASFSDFILNNQNKNLIADFDFYPKYPFAGMTITFNASLSYPVEIIERYEWYLGDGSNGSGMIVTHSYFKPGIYRVKLVIWDQYGNSNSTEKEINIKDLTYEINSLRGIIENLTSQTSSLKDRINIIVNNLTNLMQVLKNETDNFSIGITKLRDEIINLTKIFSSLNDSIVYLNSETNNLREKIRSLENTTNIFKSEINELRDEVHVISGRLLFGSLLLLGLLALSLGVFFKRQARHALENREQFIILQREIEELKKSLPESSLFSFKYESIYNDFTRNIDIFEELSLLTGRSVEELYEVYKSYILKEYDGKVSPIEGFLFRIGEQYKLNFIDVLEGQKPLGLVLTGKNRQNTMVRDAAVNAVKKRGYFLFQSILDERLSSTHILKRAEKSKILCLVSLSYIQKSDLPEIQLGSRNISDAQLISHIITDLEKQNIYVKKADERFLGGYLVKESEKYGIKCFQLTFLGNFSEGEVKESLISILDIIFSNILKFH